MAQRKVHRAQAGRSAPRSNRLLRYGRGPSDPVMCNVTACYLQGAQVNRQDRRRSNIATYGPGQPAKDSVTLCILTERRSKSPVPTSMPPGRFPGAQVCSVRQLERLRQGVLPSKLTARPRDAHTCGALPMPPVRVLCVPKSSGCPLLPFTLRCKQHLTLSGTALASVSLQSSRRLRFPVQASALGVCAQRRLLLLGCWISHVCFPRCIFLNLTTRAGG